MTSVSVATTAHRPHLESFFKHYPASLASSRLDCYLSHNHTVIAQDGNQIVGILQWCLKEDPSLGVVEFEEVFVTKDYQGQGIGTRLVQFALQEVLNYFQSISLSPRKIFLFVSENNLSARHLYEKFGFKQTANVGNLFSNLTCELFYSLDLIPLNLG
ncbi:MAG: GNAT family N-acetyltransferase [Candidatus Shapirobacteria bacterium]|jgi:ribosomal protein S18 acetylase RimI-like enzyme